MEVVDVPEYSCRTQAIILAIASLVVWAWVFFGMSKGRKLARRLLGLCLIFVFFVACFFISFPLSSERKELNYEMQRRWILWRNPNVLNYYANDELCSPQGFSLKESQTGNIMSYRPADLNVLLNSNNVPIFCGVRIKRSSLQAIIEGRRKRGLTSFRTFLWIDRHASMEARGQLIDSFPRDNRFPLYEVGVRTVGKEKGVFVADKL